MLVGALLAGGACRGEAELVLLPLRDQAAMRPDAEAAGGLSERDAGPAAALDGGAREPAAAGDASTATAAGVDAAAGPVADAGVAGIRLQPRLRYDFVGVGSLILDRSGDADAQAKAGAELDGEGGIALDGEDDYIDLPNGVLAGLSETTLMVWVRWDGDVCWERIFDFGVSVQGEGEVGQVATSLFLTPLACGAGGAGAFIELGDTTFALLLPEALPGGILSQLTLVLATADKASDAGAGMRMRLFVDGELRGEADAAAELGQIEDLNVWLGRSQWVQDGHFKGYYEELRLYDRALTETEVQRAYLRGPDLL